MNMATAPAGLPTAALRILVSHRGTASRPDLQAGPAPDLLGWSAAISGATALIGAPGVNNDAGAVYVFTRAGSRWTLRAVLTDPRDRPNDYFGLSIAMAAHTALIGAPGFGRGVTGHVYVYGGSGADWTLRTTIGGPHSPPGDGFGYSVVLAGTSALIGEYGRTRASHGYVYVRSGADWRLRATLTGSQHAAGDYFSDVIAFSGSTAVLAALGAGGFSGLVYVYQRSGTRWRLDATLADPKHTAGDDFGIGLAISGSTILVGADGASAGAGIVYQYVESGTAWTLDLTLRNPRGKANGNFGASVALNDSAAVIGAIGGHGTVYAYAREGHGLALRSTLDNPRPGQANHYGYGENYGYEVTLVGATILAGAWGVNNEAGTVYVYGQSGSRWQLRAALADPRGYPGDDKGAAVAISGNTAVVGAWGADNQRGTAYIFVNSGTGWRLRDTLSDPDQTDGDWFGAAVAISGSTVLIGAWGAYVDRGAAFAYSESGGRWRLSATFADPRRKYGDSFGSSVAIEGSTAIVGADGADGNTGAAYIYDRSGTHWHKRAALTDPGNNKLDDFGESVALAGGRAVVGANGVRYQAGAAYVYAKSSSGWHLSGTLADPRDRPNDEFGTSVAVSGTAVVVGTPGASDFQGAAYVFGRSGSRWHRDATLTISRRANVAGGFGGAVAVTGTGTHVVALISGLSTSGLATANRQCGSAFEFGPPSGRWRELARVANPKCTSYDEFGYAVAISGDTALIGAPGTNHDAGTAWILNLVQLPGEAG